MCSALSRSLRVRANVVERVGDLDVEARVRGDAEALARRHRAPLAGAGELVLRAAAHALHHLRGGRIERQLRGEDHPYRLPLALSGDERVADALAAKVHARLCGQRHVREGRCDGAAGQRRGRDRASSSPRSTKGRRAGEHSAALEGGEVEEGGA
eukprot:CAMPEP_0170179024 /NCGR_PEP_ID=MMETSP0040_2-20121228/15891_1 /TAXON_ID=641309 /ORGANISM="Lotharella oceanica, Strain CCMP622" /LENGTH=154 /DNA_ID=CAMNT_0010422797 /DNA_START=214 /DNA_END=674 /DNA_ORIENTATION=+